MVALLSLTYCYPYLAYFMYFSFVLFIVVSAPFIVELLFPHLGASFIFRMQLFFLHLSFCFLCFDEDT